MSVAGKQFGVYVRFAVVAVAVAAVAMVLVKNRNHTVSVWFYGLTDDTKPINVVWLMLCTAAATLVVWWILALGWGLVRDFREVRRLRAITDASRSVEQRHAELDERERRIDDKLHRAVKEEGEQP